MGFAISWCAVPEAAAGGFLQRIGLTETGETEEVPDSLISVGPVGYRMASPVVQQVRLPIPERGTARGALAPPRSAVMPH